MSATLKCPKCGARFPAAAIEPADGPVKLDVVTLPDGQMRIVMDLVFDRETALRVLAAAQTFD